MKQIAKKLYKNKVLIASFIIIGTLLGGVLGITISGGWLGTLVGAVIGTLISVSLSLQATIISYFAKGY